MVGVTRCAAVETPAAAPPTRPSRGAEEEELRTRATYAQVTAQKELLISGKGGESAQKIQQILRKEVNPAHLRVGVARMVTLGDNRVKVCCANEQQAKQMGEKIRGTTDLQVREECGLRDPRIKLRRMPTGQGDRERAKDIMAQNDPIRRAYGSEAELAGEMKTERRLRRREEGLEDLVVRVGPKLYRLIIGNPIYHGFEVTWPEEDIAPTQCFKSTRLGHIARNCQDRSRCRRCGRADHVVRECKESNPKCISCTEAHMKDVEHLTGSRRCETWLRRADALRKRTKYV